MVSASNLQCKVTLFSLGVLRVRNISCFCLNFCPLILALIGGSCGSNYYCMLLMLLFRFCHLFSPIVHWNPFARRSSLLLLLSVYSVSYLYQYRLMAIYFNLCYLFCFSSCSNFSHWELFQVGCCNFSIWTHSSLSLSTFLLSGARKCYSLILYFPFPLPGIYHFSKEPGYFLLDNGI